MRCHTTRKGYRRGVYGGRQRLEHVVVWEQHHGPLADGLQVHHINGDKTDNRIENLIAVDTVTHKRLHSGCELRDGIWFKPCRRCGEFKPVDAGNWYLSAEGWPLYGRCRPCHVRVVVEEKRLRKMRAKAA